MIRLQLRSLDLRVQFVDGVSKMFDSSDLKVPHPGFRNVSSSEFKISRRDKYSLGVYVMLSRAMSLAGLLIWDWWDPALLAGAPPASLLSELRRLRQLESFTLQRLHTAFSRNAVNAALLQLLRTPFELPPTRQCAQTTPCLPRSACVCSSAKPTEERDPVIRRPTNRTAAYTHSSG